jgi:hypothetical protein
MEWRGCNVPFLRSIAIPPNLSFIDSETFDTACTLTAVDPTSCPELARWCACHSSCNSPSAVDFRRRLRLGYELPMMTDCLIDRSIVEILTTLEVNRAGEREREVSSLLCRRRWCVIGRFESANREVGESEIEREVEKRRKLKHRYIAVLTGFTVSIAPGDTIELWTVRPHEKGGSLARILACHRPPWTGTAKARPVMGLPPGL